MEREKRMNEESERSRKDGDTGLQIALLVLHIVRTKRDVKGQRREEVSLCGRDGEEGGDETMATVFVKRSET